MAPAPVVYTFAVGDQKHRRLLGRVLAAVYTAVIDRHKQRAAPLGGH